MAVSSPGWQAWRLVPIQVLFTGLLLTLLVASTSGETDDMNKQKMGALSARQLGQIGVGGGESRSAETLGGAVVFLEVNQAHSGHSDHKHHHKHKRTQKSAHNKGRKPMKRSEYAPSNGERRKSKGKKAAKSKRGGAKGGKKAAGGGGGGGMGGMGGMAGGLAGGVAEAAGVPTSPEGLVGAALGAPPGGQAGAPGGAPGATGGAPGGPPSAQGPTPSAAPVAEVISSPGPVPTGMLNAGGSAISPDVERALNEIRRQQDKGEIQVEMLKSKVDKIEDKLAATSNSLAMERRLQKLRGSEHLLQSRFDALNAAKTESAEIRETMMKNAISHSHSAKPEMELPEKIVINEPPHQQQQENSQPMGGGMYPGFYSRPGMYEPQMMRPGMPYGSYYPNPMMMQKMMQNMKKQEGNSRTQKHKEHKNRLGRHAVSVASKASIVPSKGHHVQKPGDLKEASPKAHKRVNQKPVHERKIPSRYYTNGDDVSAGVATNGVEPYPHESGTFNGVEQVPFTEMDEMTNGLPYKGMLPGNDGSIGYHDGGYDMVTNGDEQPAYDLAFEEMPTNGQDYMEQTGWIDEDEANEDDDQWAAEQASDGEDTADMDSYDPEEDDYQDVDVNGDAVDKEGNLLDGPSNQESEQLLQEDAQSGSSDMANDDTDDASDKPSDTNGGDSSSDDGGDPFADGLDVQGELSGSEDAVDNLEREVELQEKS